MAMNENRQVEEGKKRLASIDVLRGLNMFWILCAVMTFRYLFKAWPNEVTAFLDAQSRHIRYGLHVTDVIFPTFLFLAGVSWPFSLAGMARRGVSTRRVLWKIAVRFLLLFLLGWAQFGLFSFDVTKMSIVSILGRIGFGWAVMALVTYFLPRRWWLVALALFLAQPVLSVLAQILWGTPGAGVPTLCGHWDGTVIIKAVDDQLMKLFPAKWPREGFWGCYGPVLSAFIGYGAGLLLRDERLAPRARTWWLLGSALVFGALGAATWLVFCPCAKFQWNTTFILVSGAIDLALLGVLHELVDVRGRDRWTLFFKVIGANALAMYIFGDYISFKPGVTRVLGGAVSFLPSVWAPVVNELAGFLCRWLVFYWLYRRRIFIRV